MLIYCKTRGKWYNPQPLFFDMSFPLRTRLAFAFLSALFSFFGKPKFFHFHFFSFKRSILIMSNIFYIILQKNTTFTAFSLLLSRLQEVGSIIGKKGEIVKRFREEVSYCYEALKWLKNLACSQQQRLVSKAKW